MGTQKTAVGQQIKHVIVLMLENRSFDQMLGDYRNHSGFERLAGIDANNPQRCFDYDGNEYVQSPGASLTVSPDAPHELDSVLRQMGLPVPALPEVPDWLKGERLERFLRAMEKIQESWKSDTRYGQMAAGTETTMLDPTHFINEYARHGGAESVQQRHEIIKYFQRGELPALHRLADNFLICDHWHSSVPGPTWTNRFFVHSGTSCGVARMVESPTDYWGLDVYDQDTIFDRLSAAGVTWRIYFGDAPQSVLLLNQAKKQNLSNYKWFGYFENDVSNEGSDFPSYVFIEPSYYAIGNDDHPPHNVMAGQTLIAKVYNTIRSKKELWENSLLIVTYDEHGGFYDHVVPPAAAHPGGVDMKEWTFDSLGLRVPAILVSPYVKQGVYSAPLEHSSILRFLIDRFGLDELTDRVNAATSLAPALMSHRRTNTPTQIGAGGLTESVKLKVLNELQKAVVFTARWAERQFGEKLFGAAADEVIAYDQEMTSADFEEAQQIMQSLTEAHAEGQK